jgi:hypothetical protein
MLDPIPNREHRLDPAVEPAAQAGSYFGKLVTGTLRTGALPLVTIATWRGLDLAADA